MPDNSIHPDTDGQFKEALKRCRDIFARKLQDYGPSWRIMRPAALTDQLLIKAKRIRTLETTGVSRVGEGILPEFVALVNYAIVGTIQLRHGYADHKDMSADEALALYDTVADEAFALMQESRLRRGVAYDARIVIYRFDTYKD